MTGETSTETDSSPADGERTVVVQHVSDGRVAIVTIDRPRVRNAIDAATTHQLEDAIDAIEADERVAVSILTGSGDTVFSAGMDLKAFAKTGVRGMATRRGGFAGVTRRRFTKPIIAAVNGSALGGGLEIALACDLIVASSTATFGLPEVSRGLIAGAGGLVRLPRRLPLSVALKVALTGDPLSAEEARDLGLVNDVYPPEELLEGAIELANRVAKNAPLALQLSRKVMLDSLDGSEQDAWTSNDEAFRTVGGSDDAREGATAFAERRTPVWVGH
jgi:enoyl-CoA hydratase